MISGRLKSPAMTTFGCFVCVFCIVLSEIRVGHQAIGDDHWGSVVGGKVNGFVSYKLNCVPYYFAV